LAELSINHYNYALQRVSNGHPICFMVAKHKTTGTAGGAVLSLSTEEARLLAAFVALKSVFFSNIANCSNKLFLNMSGKCMSQSNISSVLSRAFGRRVSSTAIRKSTVTLVHGKHGALKSDLAGMMNHDERTAKRDYDLTDKTEKPVATAEFLRGVVKSHNCPSTVEVVGLVGTKTEEAEDDVQSSAGTITLPLTAQQPLSAPMTANLVVNTQPMAATAACANVLATRPKRKRWSEENTSTVYLIFKDLISEQSSGIGRIREILAFEVVFSEKVRREMCLTSDEAFFQCVREKIRSLFRNKKTTSPRNKKSSIF